MTRDPFYNEIVERLNKRLDPEIFEHCALDLLRSDYPTLVPIRGGRDAGRDGEAAGGENEFFVVCTTAKSVIGNLTKNLVLVHIRTYGYRVLSFMRASSVVNCQSTPFCFSLRVCSQLCASLCNVSISGIRRLRHCLLKALSSISAMLSQLPCLGV